MQHSLQASMMQPTVLQLQEEVRMVPDMHRKERERNWTWRSSIHLPLNHLPHPLLVDVHWELSYETLLLVWPLETHDHCWMQCSPPARTTGGVSWEHPTLEKSKLSCASSHVAEPHH
jgi:hypothetical protein